MNPVAILFDNLGPYHLARLRAAAGTCRLTAIEVAPTSGTYAWTTRPGTAASYERVTLLGEGHSGAYSPRKLSSLIERALDACGPAVVFVPGWASAAAWAAMRWCLRLGVPMVVMSESTVWDEPRSWWKERIKRSLVATFSAALVGGRLHRDYLVQLGMSVDDIALGYDAVDNAYFEHSSETMRNLAAGASELPRPYFLASARFVPKKNLPFLLEAYARYRSGCGSIPWSLVLLGDGEERDRLERLRESLGLGDTVRMPGFVQYEHLPGYYARAGAFVHASTEEPWGLVVNEAAASGLPLLISNRVGCAPELVQPGTNGFLFAPDNVDELAVRMSEMATPSFPRQQFGDASRRIVRDWDVARFADGFAQAVSAALARGPGQSGFPARQLLSALLLR